MTNQPIITANAIRDYVRAQNVAPEAAPGLKMLMQAAQQIDQLASAAMKWQDQTALVQELQGKLAAAELAAAELAGEDAQPSHDMQALVDDACVMFGIESYGDFLPKLADVQSLMTRQNEALMERDRQLDEADERARAANEVIGLCAATVSIPMDAEPQVIIKAIEDVVNAAAFDEAARMEGKREYARLHQLLDTICEKTQIPEIRFDQLPRHIERIVALINDCAVAVDVEDDVTELPERVRALVESHRTAVAQRDDARDELQQEKDAHAQTQKLWLALKGEQNRIAMALGLTAPTVQETLDAIESLTGSDNVVTPAVDSSWLNDAIDLCHAVAGDLSRENRIMARTARALIQTAPRGEDE